VPHGGWLADSAASTIALMTRTATPPSAHHGSVEDQLLAQLGMSPGSSESEIESAHDEIIDFLRAAPASLRSWARLRTAEADEAYARLQAGPQAADPAAFDAGPAPGQPAARRSRRSSQPIAEPGAEAAAVEATGRPRNIRGGLRYALGGVVALAVVAIVVVVYNLGAPTVPAITGSPAPGASGGVDPAQVTALMTQLAANPKDTTTLQSLADLYYGAGDYTTALTWLGQLLAVDPQNVSALLGSGAASYNLGDLPSAETAWRKVLAIDSSNVEAHYDLGFMYLSEDPPDMAQVTTEWNEVIALAPGSDIANTVATHLQSLAGSPAPSGAAPSGAASAAPTGSPAPSSPSPSIAPQPS
jgi:tetratricopeptide (TPR) repeat protein